MDLPKINTRQSPEELLRAKQTANAVNKSVNPKGTEERSGMGKDSFLKLLITELRHQDPTQPMADREFISQMAQFSSLEQMTNMNKEIASLKEHSKQSEAFSLLGKSVDALDPATNRSVSGIVTSVQFKNGGYVLTIGRKEVLMENIHAVYNTPPNQKSYEPVQQPVVMDNQVPVQ
jgi:flagellar basal-body rod modification protein FlgD